MGHVFGDQLVSIEFHCVNIGTYSPAMDTWFGDRKKSRVEFVCRYYGHYFTEDGS